MNKIILLWTLIQLIDKSRMSECQYYGTKTDIYYFSYSIVNIHSGKKKFAHQYEYHGVQFDINNFKNYVINRLLSFFHAWPLAMRISVHRAQNYSQQVWVFDPTAWTVMIWRENEPGDGKSSLRWNCVYICTYLEKKQQWLDFVGQGEITTSLPLRVHLVRWHHE